MFSIAAFVIISLSVILNYIRNKDTFSPTKIYTVFFIIFYFNFFIKKYSFEVSMTYVCMLLMLIPCAITEKSYSLVGGKFKNHAGSIYVNKVKISNVVFFIWIFSLIPIFNQLYILYEFGGLANYVNNMAFRVEAFKGRGLLLVLSSYISIANVLYFSFLVLRENKKIDIVLYIFHLILFIFIGLLSGSRSFIVISVIVMMIVYSYIVGPIKKKYILSLILLIMVFIVVVGGARGNYFLQDGTLKLKSGDGVASASNYKHFEYGLIPLELVFSKNPPNLYYGMTYLSLITNFIPRSIYPEKPDTGGLVFTKDFADNRWGGLSNLATGTVAEGVINWGFFFGVPIGIFFNFAMFMFGLFLYRRLLEKTRKKYLSYKNIFFIVGYSYFLLSIARLSYSEFTDVFFKYILSILIPLLFLYYFCQFRILRK